MKVFATGFLFLWAILFHGLFQPVNGQLLNPVPPPPPAPRESLVKWKSLKEALALQAESKKPLFIDMYTDWCGWCKKMDAETFNHPAIAEYLNFYFIPVKFDAEGSDTIEFKGTRYVNERKGPRSTHQLAIQLLQGRLSYPTIVYLDAEGIPNPVPGYRNPVQIEPFLIYFSESINKSAPFEDFQKAFDRTFRDSTPIPTRVQWFSFPQALEMNQKNPKKILAIVHSKFNRGSQIMLKTTFADSTVAAYINKHFYLASIEAETTDTIRVGDQVFFNELKVPNYPHQLAIALLQGKMAYPASVYFDENSQMVNRVNGFYAPKGIEPVLHFFGTDAYKNTPWETFLKTFQSAIPPDKVNEVSTQSGG